MALINIRRRCEECETTWRKLDEVQRELDNFRLDYQNLYEKVRTNLAKLSKRAERAEKAEEEGDPVAEARRLLIARKLERRGA